MAWRQHGVATRQQLIRLGLTPDTIDSRVRSGRLILLHRGVYAVGHRPPSPHAKAMAAVLACGLGAILSHRWAGWLWGFLRLPSGPVDVIAPVRRQRPGIRTHRSQALTSRDLEKNYGIPVTSIARTLVDLADELNDRDLARAVNDARAERRSTLPQLKAILARSPGRNTTRLRPFVEHAGPPTQSVFEDEFLAFAEHHRLPRPNVNQHIAGHTVDMHWPDHDLALELDSREHHDNLDQFETDRDRDVDLLIAGVPVIRLTWKRMTETPEREAARLKRLLSGP